MEMGELEEGVAAGVGLGLFKVRLQAPWVNLGVGGGKLEK